MSFKSYWRRLTPPDAITFVFTLVAMALIVVRSQTIGPHAWTYVLYYFLAFLSAAVAAPWMDTVKHPIIQNHVVQFVRRLYPALYLGAFFNWTEPVSNMFFDQPLDEYILALDLAIFGYSPGAELASRLGNNYYLTEFMCFSYMSYYITPWPVVYCHFAGMKKEFAYTATISCLIMFTCYLLQSMFPVQGPIYYNPELGGHLHAGPIAAAAASFLSGADVPGSAMPSGHVAGTMGIFFLTYIFFRKSFYFFAPLWIALCVATVYGRFHYVVDGVAGLFIAAIMTFWVGPKLYAYLYPDLLPDALKKEAKDPAKKAAKSAASAVRQARA